LRNLKVHIDMSLQWSTGHTINYDTGNFQYLRWGHVLTGTVMFWKWRIMRL